jgi:hypothetical protein
MPRRALTGQITANQQLDAGSGAGETLQKSAMSGDMTMVITPATVTTDETSSAWTRDVAIKITDTSGNIHTWLTADYATTASIADTSSLGTATIASTTLSLDEGEATITVSGDAVAWSGGVQQEESITVTNGVDTADGTLVFTVTAAGMSNSPKAVNVALTNPTSANDTAAAIGAALELDADVSAFFTVDVTTATIKLTAIAAAANDATMAMALTDADGTGVTVGASGDTTAGVAPETDTLTIGNITVMGYTVTGGTSVETFSL